MFRPKTLRRSQYVLAAYWSISAVAAPPSPAPRELRGTIHITKALTKRKISLPQAYERTDPGGADVESGGGNSNWADAEIHRVVVYIEGRGPLGTPTTATLDQRNRHFEPEIVVIPPGSTVVFPNSDPVFHNVFSLSKTKQFDLGNYAMGHSRSVSFTQPGIVSVHCHLHPNMAATVVVVPNAWYTQPDVDGSFRLSGIPPGDYTLVAWHKSAGAFRRSIHVTGAIEEKPIDIEIPVRAD